MEYTPLEEMKELATKLNDAARMYYQENSTIISDKEYDALYDRFADLEKETGIVLANSPTRKVGYEVMGSLQKVTHTTPLLSLDKTKDIVRLKEWLGDREGVLSWKLDGLTILLTYDAGELVQAVTRGNGTVGEDVTHNARVFANVPLKIPFSGRLSLRGEGVISYSMFQKINESLPPEELYKNPRNLCSGTVRQLNSEIAAKRQVMFFAFGLMEAADGAQMTEKTEQLAFLESLGFDVVYHLTVTENTLEVAIEAFSEKTSENDFASDGLVLTYNNIAYSESLGSTSKFPRDSIAFKWADETEQTVLRQIEWNTSRTGLMNPIAIFDPVELSGSTVSRASLHNVSVLQDLELGIGDEIRVYKANMIIPQISENLTKSGNAEIPAHCFVCGGETEIRALKEGSALYCTNINCPAQRLQALSHFVGRNAMNMEGLSEETLRKLLDAGLIADYPDLFLLKNHKEALGDMEGMGEKSCQNLIEAIEKARTIPLNQFLYALGINHVGQSNAKLLCRYAEYDLNRILELTEEELVKIDGFGQVIAHSVHGYFHNSDHLALLERALEHITFTPPPDIPAVTQSGIAGKTFVITGDLEQFENRNALKERIELLGGKATGSVSKKTDYLINNDIHSPSSKNKKAAELGIAILDEQKLLELFPELKD